MEKKNNGITKVIENYLLTLSRKNSRSSTAGCCYFHFFKHVSIFMSEATASSHICLSTASVYNFEVTFWLISDPRCFKIDNTISPEICIHLPFLLLANFRQILHRLSRSLALRNSSFAFVWKTHSTTLATIATSIFSSCLSMAIIFPDVHQFRTRSKSRYLFSTIVRNGLCWAMKLGA